MVEHYVKLPWHLYGKAEVQVFYGGIVVEIRYQTKLLVIEDTIIIFFNPHSNAFRVVWMLFVQFLDLLLCNVIHIHKHNKGVPIRLFILEGEL